MLTPFRLWSLENLIRSPLAETVDDSRHVKPLLLAARARSPQFVGVKRPGRIRHESFFQRRLNHRAKALCVILAAQSMKEERRVVIASDSGISIGSFTDVSDALGACIGTDGFILTENDLAPEFFDLHSGLAGELFQKFMNYRLRIAIILPDPDAYGERFSELAYEHRSHNMIRFVSSQDQAIAWLDT